MIVHQEHADHPAPLLLELVQGLEIVGAVERHNVFCRLCEGGGMHPKIIDQLARFRELVSAKRPETTVELVMVLNGGQSAAMPSRAVRGAVIAWFSARGSRLYVR